MQWSYQAVIGQVITERYILCLTATEMRQVHQMHGNQAQGMDRDQTAWVRCIVLPLIQLQIRFDMLASV